MHHHQSQGRMHAFNFCAGIPACSTPTHYSYVQTTLSSTRRPLRRVCRASSSADPRPASSKAKTDGTKSQPSHRAPPTRLVLEMTRVLLLAGIILGFICLVDVIFGLIALSLAVIYTIAALLGARDIEQWPSRFAAILSHRMRKLSLRIRGLKRRWKQRK